MTVNYWQLAVVDATMFVYALRVSLLGTLRMSHLSTSECYWYINLATAWKSCFPLTIVWKTIFIVEFLPIEGWFRQIFPEKLTLLDTRHQPFVDIFASKILFPEKAADATTAAISTGTVHCHCSSCYDRTEYLCKVGQLELLILSESKPSLHFTYLISVFNVLYCIEVKSYSKLERWSIEYFQSFTDILILKTL